MWTPFAFVRGTGTYLNYDTSRVYSIYNAFGLPLTNSSQSFYYGADNVVRANVLPGIGLEYRYPFFSKTPLGNVTFEPIAQIISRPDRGLGSNSLVDIDSQSLVFDDSSLFEWNKFSGYDRFETGTRANYGGQATLNLNGGGFVNVMAGQSLQVAGRNGFATADAANVGLSSGLDTRRSDYVGRFAFAPNSVFSFVAKGRFDVNTLSPRRIDLIAGATFGPLTLNAQYANYASQPLIGFDVRRQGLSFGGRYDITSNYYVAGRVTFDLSRHLYDNVLGVPAFFYNSVNGQSIVLPQTALSGTAPLFSIANLALGAGYHDDCTTLSVNYSMVYQPNSLGQPARNQTVLVSLQLRTLGQASFGTSLGTSVINDGLKQLP
jgi:LPS-assembly protein